MMYIALTYDHRLIDGREAVTFLRELSKRLKTRVDSSLACKLSPSLEARGQGSKSHMWCDTYMWLCGVTHITPHHMHILVLINCHIYVIMWHIHVTHICDTYMCHIYVSHICITPHNHIYFDTYMWHYELFYWKWKCSR